MAVAVDTGRSEPRLPSVSARTVVAMDVVRTVVVVLVAALLAQRAGWAWRHRATSVRVWRAIRPRHVLGAVGLLAVVMATFVALWLAVPVTQYGVGSLVGLDGNAVFAPIDSALEEPIVQAEHAAASGQPAPGVPWWQVAGVSGFLVGLSLLFPTLAMAEEQAFRAGWEDLSLGRQVASALRFGLVHLVMLIPVAAALAVGVAGFAYGRIYLRTYRAVPPRLVVPAWGTAGRDDAGARVQGPPTPVLAVDRAEARRQAVFAATVWHTTFNTTVAAVVLVGYLTSL